MLGPNQYGKAETRLVLVRRGAPDHELVDLNVSVALAGDLTDTHLTGDNANVLPTDTQKNTVYAFAREHGVASLESFGRLLARHFVDSQPAISGARVSIDSYGWRPVGPTLLRPYGRRGAHGGRDRVRVGRPGSCRACGTWCCSTRPNSEFHGFVRDRYTTLPDATDRILATAVDASWRHAASRSRLGRLL